jgi:hypothetical protein
VHDVNAVPARRRRGGESTGSFLHHPRGDILRRSFERFAKVSLGHDQVAGEIAIKGGLVSVARPESVWRNPALEAASFKREDQAPSSATYLRI